MEKEAKVSIKACSRVHPRGVFSSVCVRAVCLCRDYYLCTEEASRLQDVVDNPLASYLSCPEGAFVLLNFLRSLVIYLNSSFLKGMVNKWYTSGLYLFLPVVCTFFFVICTFFIYFIIIIILDFSHPTTKVTVIK